MKTIIAALMLIVPALAAEPNRLPDGQGGYLLATPAVQSDTDSTLNILRIVGNPNTTGRMLALNANASDDHTIMHVRAFAVDGASPIVLTEIFGSAPCPTPAGACTPANNVVVIASCPTPAGKTVGECNYDWPAANMAPGNNELRMEYTRAGGLKFQTYGRVGKP